MGELDPSEDDRLTLRSESQGDDVHSTFTLVDLSGDYANFDSEADYANFIQSSIGWDNDDTEAATVYISATSAYPTLEQILDDLYAEMDIDSSEVTEERIIAENSDILKVIDLEDGESIVLEKNEGLHPAYILLNQNGIMKVGSNYLRVLNGVEYRNSSKETLLSINENDDGVPGDVQVDTVVVVIDEGDLEPRMDCNHLNEWREGGNRDNDNRRCRNDRRVTARWIVLKAEFEDAAKGKWTAIVGTVRSSSFRKRACTWLRYRTNHYRKGIDFNGVFQAKDAFDNLVFEGPFGITNQSLHTKTERKWDYRFEAARFPKDDGLKLTACWMVEKGEFSHRGMSNKWLIVD